MQPCPSEGKDSATTPRVQPPVSLTRKPIQAVGPSSPTWGETTQGTGTMTLQPVERRPQTQQFRENEKTEKYVAEKGAR